ncbi:choice-of-anchor D domain-containing protein [Solirubrobacter taibaiensis]|nr:choice-of-anchor D domain-containing protein [Solirubrobacter taibaiensis]
MKSLFALVVVLLLVPVTSSHAAITRGWAPSGSMREGRADAKAVLLDDGRVLVAGGSGGSPYGALRSVELYDPATGTWSAAAPMRDVRSSLGLVKLTDGRVLATGGNPQSPMSNEIYDPVRDLWTPVNTFNNQMRSGGLLAALPNGRAVIVGGDGGTSEVFEPRTSSWSTLLTVFPGGGVRWLHAGAVAALPDGRAVITGGVSPDGGTYTNFTDVKVFDGAAWTPFPNMLHRRSGHALIRLPGGRLLAAGGSGNEGFVWPAEVYEPNVNAWQQAGPMLSNRFANVTTALADGGAMVIGGIANNNGLKSTERFVPSTRTWTPGDPTLTAHVNHTATLLRDGRVLVAGGRPDGFNPGPFSGATEIWTPTTTFAVDPAAGFGDQVLGAAAAGGAKLTNTGDQPLITDGASITGPDAGDFAADVAACRTVAPGASCTIPLRFTPSVAGARAATLTFATNSAAAAPVIALSGAGVAPPLPLGAGPDGDGDGVPDAQDRCPATRGGAARTGCPAGLLADPSIRYQRLKRGIKVIAYYVKATTGARITVTCTKKACKRAVAKGAGPKPVRIKTLNGKRLRNGTRIAVAVAMPGRLTTTVTDRIAKSRRTEGRPRCTPIGC